MVSTNLYHSLRYSTGSSTKEYQRNYSIEYPRNSIMTTVSLRIGTFEIERECTDEEIGALVVKFTSESEETGSLHVPKYMSRKTMQPQVEEVATEL